MKRIIYHAAILSIAFFLLPDKTERFYFVFGFYFLAILLRIESFFLTFWIMEDESHIDWESDEEDEDLSS